MRRSRLYSMTCSPRARRASMYPLCTSATLKFGPGWTTSHRTSGADVQDQGAAHEVLPVPVGQPVPGGFDDRAIGHGPAERRVPLHRRVDGRGTDWGQVPVEEVLPGRGVALTDEDDRAERIVGFAVERGGVADQRAGLRDDDGDGRVDGAEPVG